jgi:hypothetical protein
MKTGLLPPADPVTGLNVEEDDFFLMANLSPLFTGLPFVVWISAKGGARHDIRVKISRSAKVKPDELITVALRPTLHTIGSEQLREEELALLTEWINKNWTALWAFWNGDLYTEEVLPKLQPVRVKQKDENGEIKGDDEAQ